MKDVGNTLLLLRYLVRSYAVAKDLSTDELPSISIADFLNWCGEQLKKQNNAQFSCFDYSENGESEEPDVLFPDKAALKKQLGVSSEDLDCITTIVSRPMEYYGFLQVYWPMLVLDIGKPPEQNNVSMIMLSVKVVYDDKSIIELNVPCVADEREKECPHQVGTKLTTGVVLSIWLSQINQLVRTIANCGGNDGLKSIYDSDKVQELEIDNCSLPFGCKLPT